MKYIISAGGSGGHIYPALEIAKKLDCLGHDVTFYAANKNIDHNIIDREDLKFNVKFMRISGIQREITLLNLIKNFLNLFNILFVTLYAIGVMIKNRPDYVVGFGGYVTFPFVFIASLFKINTAIHEQNSYPGLVNRKLSTRVDKVFYTFESSLKYFPQKANMIYTSNPRVSAVKEKLNEGVHCNIDIERAVVFIGGSLGAEKINDIAFQYADNNPSQKVLIVTGERYFEKYKDKKVNDNVRLIKYLNDPIDCFLCAKYVVSRSGASTLLELMSAHALCVFIPSPNVTADQQTINAKEFVDKEMTTMIKENELTLESLQYKFNYLEDHKDKYLKNLETFSNIDSKKMIIEEING